LPGLKRRVGAGGDLIAMRPRPRNRRAPPKIKEILPFLPLWTGQPDLYPAR